MGRMRPEGPMGPQLRRLLRRRGLRRKDAARLLHVTEERVNRWCLPDESSGHRQMPMAMWELLKLKSARP